MTATKCPPRWAPARNRPEEPAAGGSAVPGRAALCAAVARTRGAQPDVSAGRSRRAGERLVGVATGEQPATPRAAQRPFRAWRTEGSASNIHSRPPRRRCPAACGCGNRAPVPRGRNGRGHDGVERGGGTKARARLPGHALPEHIRCRVGRSFVQQRRGAIRAGDPAADPDLTVLTAGARKCADTTTVDSSQRSHEAAQSRCTGKHGG